MFRLKILTLTGNDPNLRLWDYEKPWGPPPAFTPFKGRLVSCEGYEGGVAREVERALKCIPCAKGYKSLRAFKSIQAPPIQTHPAQTLLVETGQVCLYRSGLYRFKDP